MKENNQNIELSQMFDQISFDILLEKHFSNIPEWRKELLKSIWDLYINSEQNRKKWTLANLDDIIKNFCNSHYDILKDGLEGKNGGV